MQTQSSEKKPQIIYENEILMLNSFVQQYRDYRPTCLNLIASENVVSPFVLDHLEVSLESRYGDYFETDLKKENTGELSC